MTRIERALASARASYVEGVIDLEEFEERITPILDGSWRPTMVMDSILKDVWDQTDKPGGIAWYGGVAK